MKAQSILSRVAERSINNQESLMGKADHIQEDSSAPQEDSFAPLPRHFDEFIRLALIVAKRNISRNSYTK